MLSDYGKRMYVPKGIVVQSSEAKQKATKYNATIGVALDHGTAMYIPAMKAQFAPTMSAGEIFPYAPMGGIPALRKKWQEDMIMKNPLLEGKTMSLPAVCGGLTSALSTVCSLFLEKGQSVVMPDLYWENYNLVLNEQRQAKKVLYEFFDNGGFNVRGLDEALTSVSEENVVVMFNFPNNPTGYTPTETEADSIADVLKKHAQNGKKLVVICDDAYFGLFFEDDVCRQSLFARFCDLHENILAVKCDAATKEEMVWGFRIAFVTYAGKGLDPEHLDAICQKTLGCIRGNLSCCTTSGQNILLKGMKDENYLKDKKNGVEIIGHRYKALKKALESYRDCDCLVPYPFNSGYFMSLITKCNAEELRQHLLNDYGTGVIRQSDHLIRLAFSSIDEENIQGLVDTVFKAASELCGDN